MVSVQKWSDNRVSREFSTRLQILPTILMFQEKKFLKVLCILNTPWDTRLNAQQEMQKKPYCPVLYLRYKIMLCIWNTGSILKPVFCPSLLNQGRVFTENRMHVNTNSNTKDMALWNYQSLWCQLVETIN